MLELVKFPLAPARAALLIATLALQRRSLADQAKDWDESKHPRKPKGSPEGGQFAASPAYIGSLEKIGAALGSNPGGVYKDPSGQKVYVKNYAKPEQAFAEQIANKIYQLLGAHTPETAVNAEGQFISKWQTDVKGTLGQVGLSKDVSNRILDHFAADVFLNNWDVVGTGHDNILVSEGHKVTRVDQGGTLLFRAQGLLKPESGLHNIDEWDSLVSKNTYYNQVFKAAGVKDADSLGSRAIWQINEIAAARPNAGWQSLVDKTVPFASPEFRTKVGGMLEARYNKLLAKRDQLMIASDGLPSIIPSSIPEIIPVPTAVTPLKVSPTMVPISIATKPQIPTSTTNAIYATTGDKKKAPPATKEQIAKAWEMKKAGASYAEIQAATGLNPKQAATIIFKLNKAQGGAATDVKKAKSKQPVFTPTTTIPKPAGSPNIFDTISKEQKKLTEDKITLTKEWSDLSLDEKMARASDAGLIWKEKISGPQKGKYAFFNKIGVQVSSPFAKDEYKLGVETLYQSKGIAPGVAASIAKVGTAGGSTFGSTFGTSIYGDTTEANTTVFNKSGPSTEESLKQANWPIDNATNRAGGTKYPGVIKDHYTKWTHSITPQENHAIYYYTGSGHRYLNPLLYAKKPKPIPDGSQNSINQITSALNKAPTPPPPELVWRGVPPKILSGKNLKVGSVITLGGFQSAAITPDKAWKHKGMVMEIKPNRGAYVDPISSSKGEQEFLLPHGLQYRVVGHATVHFNGKPHKVLQLEML